MAKFTPTNWPFYLRLIGLGLRPVDAITFVLVSISAPYVKASRDPAFKAALMEATQRGYELKAASPEYFVDERGRPILDADFNFVPREPPARIVGWLKGRVHPLLLLAG